MWVLVSTVVDGWAFVEADKGKEQVPAAVDDMLLDSVAIAVAGLANAVAAT